MFRWLRRDSRHRTYRLRHMSEALTNYPPYMPPAWNPGITSVHDASADYRRFFFANREGRIDALRMFLGTFNVVLNFDDNGVMAVSAWCPHYADALVEEMDTDGVRNAYDSFAAPWAGSLIGLNVIFDLGIYYGECLLARNPKLTWQPVRGPEPNNVAHPIFGQKNRRPFDPIKDAYRICCNIYNERKISVPPSAKISTKEDNLYHYILARADS